MKWAEIRQRYISQWLLVEALQAHSKDNQRILEELAVIQTFEDSRSAMQSYTQLHRQAPKRELYVFHTDREQLEITEHQCIGIRRAV